MSSNSSKNQKRLKHSQGVERSPIEQERDKKYAEYWLEEYGTSPDRIRTQFVFSELQRYASQYANGGVIFDFGCGTGNVLQEIRGWNIRNYLGIDINNHFIDAAQKAYPEDDANFTDRNFDQDNWHTGLKVGGFDLGLSIFVLNELKNPRNYLRGIKALCKPAKNTSIKKRSRLAMVITHPVMVLKDLSDFYEARSNQRKFENIEAYRSPEEGLYTFTRGDFSIPYKHWPMTDLFRMFKEEKWHVEEYVEGFYSINSTVSEDDIRSHVGSQYPKYLLLILRG